MRSKSCNLVFPLKGHWEQRGVSSKIMPGLVLLKIDPKKPNPTALLAFLRGWRWTGSGVISCAGQKLVPGEAEPASTCCVLNRFLSEFHSSVSAKVEGAGSLRRGGKHCRRVRVRQVELSPMGAHELRLAGVPRNLPALALP